MAISARKRASLKSSDFAYPRTRSYPIDTKKRARNALARANQSGTSGTYAHVAAAVRRKWGSAIKSVTGKRGTKPPTRAARSRKPSAATRRTYAARLRRAKNPTRRATRRSTPTASSRRSGTRRSSGVRRSSVRRSGSVRGRRRR